MILKWLFGYLPSRGWGGTSLVEPFLSLGITNVTGKSSKIWLTLGVQSLPLLSSGIEFIFHTGHLKVARRMALLNPKSQSHEPNRRDFLRKVQIPVLRVLWSYITTSEPVIVSEVGILVKLGYILISHPMCRCMLMCGCGWVCEPVDIIYVGEWMDVVGDTLITNSPMTL